MTSQQNQLMMINRQIQMMNQLIQLMTMKQLGIVESTKPSGNACKATSMDSIVHREMVVDGDQIDHERSQTQRFQLHS